MSDDVGNYVTVDISIDSTGTPREGFGTMLVVSHNAAWPERSRSYASTLEASGDWAEGTPEKLAISAAFAQVPPPPLVKVGRAGGAPTMQYTVNASTSVDGAAYGMDVAGPGITPTTVSTTAATPMVRAKVHSDLVTALNAVVGKNYTAAFAALAVADFVFTADNATNTFTKNAHTLLTGDGPVHVVNGGGALPAGLLAGTDYWVIRTGVNTFQLADTLAHAFAGTALDITTDGTGVQTLDVTPASLRADSAFTVTGSAPGNWFSLDVPDAQFGRTTLTLTHAAGTIATELDAILNEDDEWYTLITLYNSKAYALAVAAWAEPNKRTYVMTTPDTDTVNTALAGGTDVMSALLAFSYANTMYAFHPRPAAMFGAAWMGRFLPTLPGKATPALKQLNGVETVKLNSTMRGNLVAKRGNSYEKAGGRGVTFNGTVGNTTFAFFDVTRNRDWLADEVRSNVFGNVAGADIVPYTPEGVAQVVGLVHGSLFGIAQDQGVIARDPAPVITAPVFDSISSTDKQARELNNIKFSGTLQGAVHKVKIIGSVTF